MKILLVEDDRTIIETLSEFLKKEGFLVKAVDSQKDALRLAEEEKLPVYRMPSGV